MSFTDRIREMDAVNRYGFKGPTPPDPTGYLQTQAMAEREARLLTGHCAQCGVRKATHMKLDGRKSYCAVCYVMWHGGGVAAHRAARKIADASPRDSECAEFLEAIRRTGYDAISNPGSKF